MDDSVNAPVTEHHDIALAVYTVSFMPYYNY